MTGDEHDSKTARNKEERRSSEGNNSLYCGKVLGARYLGFI